MKLECEVTICVALRWRGGRRQAGDSFMTDLRQLIIRSNTYENDAGNRS